jgi:4-amino-4-deoxy-L-arabinose transferase-like glycosyltransferase
MGAENLFLGKGFSRFSGGYEIRPITGFPPLYSMVLAPWRLIGLSYLEAARWLNALLLAGTLIFVAILGLRYTGSLVVALIGQALVLSRDAVFGWHTWVMSESLYIFLSLVGIWLIVGYLERGGIWRIPVGGLVVGLATLTRYVGGSLILAGALAILLLRREAFRRRVMMAGLFSIAALIPPALWMARNVSADGTLINRSVAFHTLESDLVRLFLADMSSWFVPHQVPLPTVIRALIALALATGILGFILFRVWRGIRAGVQELTLAPVGGARYRQLPWVLMVAIAAYMAALAVNSLLLDASTSASAVPRYLAPVYVLVVLLAVAVGSDVARSSTSNPVRWLLLIYAAALVIMNSLLTLPRIRDPLGSLGYIGYKYRWQRVVKELQAIPPDASILSNNPELVYVLADRPAYVRPIRYDHYQEAFRDDYKEQLDEATDLMQSGSILVVFRPTEEDDETFVEYADLEVVVDTPEAVFYVWMPD